MLLDKYNLLILNLSRPAKRLIVISFDSTFCVLSTSFAYYLRLGYWVPLFSKSVWAIDAVIFTSIFFAIPIFIFMGLYREIFRYTGVSALLALARAVAIYSFFFFSIFFVIGVDGVPRTIGFIQPIILFLLVGASRAFANYLLSDLYRGHLKYSGGSKVFIYGAGNAGRQLMAALSHSRETQVIGFLDDDTKLHGSSLSGKRIFNPADLVNLTTSFGIQSVLLAIPSATSFQRKQIIQKVQDARVSIQTLPSLSDLAAGKVTIQDLQPLDVDDLLGRDSVIPDQDLLGKLSRNKRVMITGAGGSIGSELSRQLFEQDPELLILVEQSEHALYQIHQALDKKMTADPNSEVRIIPLLGSVTNADLMRLIVIKYQPDIIYHAAAYKHVPLVESNEVEGVRNNVIGTLVMAQIAAELNVPNFMLISTDKAVRPTNIMGASKRLAEMILQALDSVSANTKFSMVRFGNVLNSSGSVVPKFRQQIKDGGPVTVTDFRITRYFMTIPEAAQLVIQASSLATGGDVFLLDMGDPVKIVDLAHRMVELAGLEVRDEANPDGDIEIKEIGLRPGEKLYEELLIDGNPEKTFHSRIFKSREDFLSWPDLSLRLKKLQDALEGNEVNLLLELLRELVSGYQPDKRLN